jgi:hypothetical protein
MSTVEPRTGVISVRLTERQKKKYILLGPDWLARKIDEAVVPIAPELRHEPYSRRTRIIGPRSS